MKKFFFVFSGILILSSRIQGVELNITRPFAVLKTTNSFSAPNVFVSSTSFSSSTVGIGPMSYFFPSSAPATGDSTFHFNWVSSRTYWGGDNAGGGGNAATLTSPATGPYNLNMFSLINISSISVSTGSYGLVSVSTTPDIKIPLLGISTAGPTPIFEVNLSSIVANVGLSVGTNLFNVTPAGMVIIGSAPSTANDYSFTDSTTTTNYHIAVSTPGHFSVGGGSPTISACGSVPNGALIAGTDNAGTISVGATLPTACTVTFQTPYKNIPGNPTCTVSQNSVVVFAGISSLTNAALTISFSAAFDGGIAYYNCIGVRE